MIFKVDFDIIKLFINTGVLFVQRIIILVMNSFIFMFTNINFTSITDNLSLSEVSFIKFIIRMVFYFYFIYKCGLLR